MQPTKNNIVIADNQFLINYSLKAIIENSTDYHCLGIAENYLKLKKLLSSDQVHLLVIDVSFFEYECYAVWTQLKNEYPDLKILVLTNILNKNELSELSKAGIKNIIYKSTNYDELFQAIDATLKKKKFYCSEVLDMLFDNSVKNKISESNYLTPSEIEVVKLISEGHTTREIAEKKHVSFHTITSHRKNIFRKLKINNVSELLMYALRAGLIEDKTEYYI
jgi:DNA-binding NarL/FixJ family response regulator